MRPFAAKAPTHMTEPNDSTGPSSESPAEDEFAGLSPAPPQRSPILALAMIGISAFTIFHLRHDLRYALTSKVPVALSTPVDTSVVGHYASVSGIPGRRDSLYVESRGSAPRETLFRLLDVTPPLFVRANATIEHVNTSGTWKGRLERLSDVSWASSITDYYKSTPLKSTRALDLDSLKAGAQLRDRRGASVSFAPDTELTITYKPSEYAIYLSRDKYPKKDDAQHELERILAQSPTTPKPTMGEDTSDAFLFFLPVEKTPAAQNALMALIAKASETSTPIDMELHSRVTKLPYNALKIENWDEVAEVRFDEPVTIGPDALVLTENDAPQTHTWTLYVALLLSFLAAFNVWYLARPRRA